MRSVAQVRVAWLVVLRPGSCGFVGVQAQSRRRSCGSAGDRRQTIRPGETTMSNGTIIILIVLAIVLFGGGGGYYWGRRRR